MGALVVALLAGRWQPLRRCSDARGCSSALRLVGVLVGVYVLFLPFYLDFVPPLVHPGPDEPCIGSACFTIAHDLARRVPHRLRAVALRPGGAAGDARLAAAAGPRRRPAAAAPEQSGGEGRHLVLRGRRPGAGLRRLRRQRRAAAAGVLLAGRLAGRLSPAARARSAPASCSSRPASSRCSPARCAFLQGLVRREALPHEHRLQALLPGWTILAIASPWALGRLLDRRWSGRRRRALITAGVALLVAASACYPLGITLDRHAARRTRRSTATPTWRASIRTTSPPSNGCAPTCTIRRSSSRRPATPTRTLPASRATPACRRCSAGPTTRACGAATTTASWRGATT